MNFNNTFYNRKVFVTGHTGFKGSWLISWLHLLGANVKGYALEPENNFDLFNYINGNNICDSVIADVRDLDRLKSEVLKYKPDFIFHLAAQPLVLESYNDPLYTYQTNVLGTANVLESLKLLNGPCIAVMVTTDKVYFNFEDGRSYKEGDKLGGYDPYSASKAASEIVIQSYRDSFFNPLEYNKHLKSISIGRAGNVIGGGDWAKNRIIPDVVRSLMSNKKINIRNPNSTRPWQHVLEPINGYLTLAAKQFENPEIYAEAFNFGPNNNDNISVIELVKKSLNIWGSGEIEVVTNSNFKHEACQLQLNIEKAKKILKWEPIYSSDQSINKTIEWYRAFMQNEKDIQSFTFEQIKKFSSINNGNSN